MPLSLPLWSKAKLGTKLFIIAFVPFLLTAVCILAALVVLSDAYSEARAQQRTRQIISDCENAIDSVLMCGTMMSMYVRSHDPEMLKQYTDNGKFIFACLDDLKSTTADEPPEMQALVKELQSHTKELTEITDSSISDLDGRKPASFLKVLHYRERALVLITREKELIYEIEKSANAEIKQAHPQRSPLHHFLRENIALAVGISVFASLSVALLLARGIVFRLKLLTDKASRLALLQAPTEPAGGNDEIAQVDRVFHDMALRLLDAIKREQAAIACSADTILSIDPSGIIQAANDAIADACGLKPQEVIGTDVLELVPASEHELIKQALSSTEPTQFEAPLRNADGKQTFSLWSTSWSPGEQCTIAIIHDVSERKAAETLLAAAEARTAMLMESMPAGLVLLCDDGVIKFANQTACQLIARTRAAVEAPAKVKETLPGRQFTALLSGGTFESPQAFVQLMSQRSQAYTTALARESGVNPVWVQLSVSKFGSEHSGQLYLVTMSDYTERWQIDELRQRLIAMIAHDIATPLMTVLNTLTLSSSGILGDLQADLQADISGAEEKSRQILQVFRNIVRFQKLAAGFSSLSATRLPLTSMTEQALDVVAEAATAKQLKLTDNCQEIDASALGDADKLSVLGATLLQTVVEASTAGAAVNINSSKADQCADWSVTVSGSPPPAPGTAAFFHETDVFGSTAGVGDDLDLILWRLLLYQCNARVSYSSTPDGYTVTLRMPSLPPPATITV